MAPSLEETRVVLTYFCRVWIENVCKVSLNLIVSDGPGKARNLHSPLVRIVEGKLRSSVTVHQKWIRHIVILNSSPGVDGTGLMVGLNNIIKKV